MPTTAVDVRTRTTPQAAAPPRGRYSPAPSESLIDVLAQASPLFSARRARAPEIPGYEIVREIGRGASAIVYLARELRHGQMVAAKVLHPVLAASLQEQRFLREIDIVGRLTHPNILPLLGSGRAGTSLYYVMPFVPGESLRARLQRARTLDIDDAVRVVCEVARGLDYAHRHGIVHRDVKPENILLADDHAVVADFGIARAVSAATDRQLTAGAVVGTPHYASPEQVVNTGPIDGRSDLYSLACVLYELITGAPPLTDDDFQRLTRRHVSETPPRLRRVVAGAPRSVDWALAVALSKAPRDRFATVTEFADALTNRGVWRTTIRMVQHAAARSKSR